MDSTRILESKLIADEMLSEREYKKIPIPSDVSKFVLDNTDKYIETENSRYLNSAYLMPNGETCVLFYLIEDSEKLDLLEYFSTTLPKYKFIIITIRDYSRSISNKFKEVTRYQVFYLEDELLLNPTKHFSVPEHKFLNVSDLDSETRKLVGKFPVIFIDDPVCKWFWAEKDQIAVITRYNLAFDTSILKSMYYRRVQ